MPTIPETLAASARSQGAVVAIVDQDGRSLTYREWDERADRVAAALARGPVSGGPVALWFHDRDWIDAAVALLGTLRAGGLAMPLSTRFPPREIAAVVEKYGVAQLVRGTGLPAPAVPTRIIEWERALATPPGPVSARPADPVPSKPPGPVSARPADPARSKPPGPPTTTPRGCLVYTSGTTGWPRAVLCEHDNLAYFLGWRPGFGAEGIIHSFPFDTAAGVLFTVFALTRGPVIRTARFDAQGFVRALEAHRPRDLMLVPANLRALLRDLPDLGKSQAAAHVRSVVLTAAPSDAGLLADVAATFGEAVLINSYSSSEAGIAAANLHYPPAGSPPPEHRPQEHPGLVCVGYPNEDTEIQVRDEAGERCPPNVVGEVYLRTPHRPPRDYYGPDRAASASVFRDGWVRMSDVGLLDTTGALHLAGRSSDLIDLGGHNVSALQIESVLRTHDGVADVAVFGVPDARLGEQVAAVVVPRGLVTEWQLRRWAAGALGEFKAPAHYAFVPELPLNAMGKVLKRTLRELLEELLASSPAPVTASREPTPAAVAELCAQVLNLEHVEPGDDFFALGGHSLAATRLIQRCQETFGVEPPMSVLLDSPDVASLAAALRHLRPGRTDATLAGPNPATATTHPRTAATSAGLSAAGVTAGPSGAGVTAGRSGAGVSAELNADAVPVPGIAGFAVPAALDDPREVLLTGATGFLGAFVLAELLASTRATVHCLVRADDDAHALARLRASLRRYGLRPEAFDGRVVPVRGDLGEAGLGLSRERRAGLAGGVEAIYHCGAEVNVVFPYRRLKAANVGGTREIIRLADLSGRAPLHHLSSVGVFAGARRGPIAESDPPGPPTGLRQGYAQSKWVGERLVAQAGEAGLPVTIHRPSRIVGHSVSGACQTDDYLWRVVKGCVQLGRYPQDLRSLVDLIPVDYVSGALVALAARPESIGRTFHLVNPEPLETRRVLEYVRDFGYDLEGCPSAAWLALVEADPANDAYPLLSVLRPGRDGDLGAGSLAGDPGVAFAADATLAHLKGAGISPPRVGPELLGRQLAYFAATGFLPPPRGGAR